MSTSAWHGEPSSLQTSVSVMLMERLWILQEKSSFPRNPSVMGGLFIRKTPSFMGSTWLGCLSACPSSSILCQAPLVPFGYFPAVFA
jgi:hypothetical protein